jgi:hypothetical protein
VPGPSEPSSEKSISALGSELWELLVRYAKQETLDPLKSLVRFLGWGLGGAICLGLGLIVLSLAGLRLLQQELAPHLSGNLSWIPYLAVIVVAVAVIAVLARAISAEKRRVDAERARLQAPHGRV